MSVQPDRWAKGDDGSKRLVQCPGCWAAAMARRDVDWECECGEPMTVVDLRERNEWEERYENLLARVGGVWPG